jgi:hypothetical protein
MTVGIRFFKLNRRMARRNGGGVQSHAANGR